MKWRNSKERELLSSGGGNRDTTIPSKDNPHPDLTDTPDSETDDVINDMSSSSHHDSHHHSHRGLDTDGVDASDMDHMTSRYSSNDVIDYADDMDDNYSGDSDEEINVS